MPRLAPVTIAVLFFKETDFIANEFSVFSLRVTAILSNESIEAESRRIDSK
jgi:hypothetical protein